jgi:hypothetical protein
MCYSSKEMQFWELVACVIPLSYLLKQCTRTKSSMLTCCFELPLIAKQSALAVSAHCALSQYYHPSIYTFWCVRIVWNRLFEKIVLPNDLMTIPLCQAEEHNCNTLTTL